MPGYSCDSLPTSRHAVDCVLEHYDLLRSMACELVAGGLHVLTEADLAMQKKAAGQSTGCRLNSGPHANTGDVRTH